MIIEEKSGQYSLMECIRVTEAKYTNARQEFTVNESAAFPEFLEKAKTGQLKSPPRRLVMDVSSVARQSSPTGVGRVELELARRFVAMAAENGFEILFTAFDGKAFEQRQFSAGPPCEFQPTGMALQFRPGDQFLMVQMHVGELDAFFSAIYHARRAGAVINYIIHDLIAIVNTSMAGNDEFTKDFFVAWSQVLRFADRVITVSRKVSRDVACYVAETSMAGLAPTRALPLAYFVLGSDALTPSTQPDLGLPYPVDENTLVAAGTLLKHKGIIDLVSAMEILWAEGSEAKLILIGANMGKGNTRAYLSTLPAFGKKLFLPGYVTDTELAETLRRCGALVCASHDEGFGLPLVEAANLGCPVIARDIEIFRETSGGDAFFFENGDAGKIAGALRKWFALTRRQQLKFVPKKSLVTWRQSAEMLRAIMFNGASSFSIEVGLKATMNLAVPGRTAGVV
jgi:glycosyltransferase involved in cell wall biosynthesis